MVVVNNMGSQWPPQWLLRLLCKNDFYTESNYCKTHNSQYETHFCKNCLDEEGGAQCFCQSCLLKSVHKHHQTGQVFTVSRKVSLHVKDLNKIWEVKEIQHNIINGKDVVLLHERTNKKEFGCRICSGQMHDPHIYKYCSIQCQLKSIYGGNIEHLQQPEALNNVQTSAALDDGLIWKESQSPSVVKGRRSNRGVEKRPRRLSKLSVEKSLDIHEAVADDKRRRLNRGVEKHRPRADKLSVEKSLDIHEAAASDDKVVVPMRRHKRKGIPHRSPMF